MRLLLLGGTVFLGRHIVEAALEAGDQVTLFNRGKHNPDLFPQVEKLYGDRDGGLDILADGCWDAVIDTCGYLPRVVRSSAQLLKNKVSNYTFISTVSVYADPPIANMEETAPLGRIENEDIEQITAETYGPLKALCERAVLQEFGEQALIIRPGLIVGPHDPSDRFTYWPVRLEQGGTVLAPGKPGRPVQFIDVRDLASWILHLIKNGTQGIYNATGPLDRLEFGKFLDVCQHVIGIQVELEWVSEQFLLEHNITPYTELPLWLPEDYAAMDMVNCRRAIQSGLTFSPLADTIAATLEWNKKHRPDIERRAGLSAQRERQLLQAWQEKLKGAT